MAALKLAEGHVLPAFKNELARLQLNTGLVQELLLEYAQHRGLSGELLRPVNGPRGGLSGELLRPADEPQHKGSSEQQQLGEDGPTSSTMEVEHEGEGPVLVTAEVRVGA